MTTEYEEGDYRIPYLDVTPNDGTTVVTLAVESPLGVTTNPVPVQSGDRWTAPGYALTAGDWYERWTVTGTGRGKAYYELKVSPDPGTLPSGARVYATTADYAHHLLTSTPTGAKRALWVASKMVDEMLLTAVYDVDDDNMPTDVDVIIAMRNATCEQAEFASTGGDRYVIGATRPSSFSLGKLSVTRPAPSAGAGLGGLGPRGEWSPRAWATLQAAGLTGHEPGS